MTSTRPRISRFVPRGSKQHTPDPLRLYTLFLLAFKVGLPRHRTATELPRRNFICRPLGNSHLHEKSRARTFARSRSRDGLPGDLPEADFWPMHRDAGIRQAVGRDSHRNCSCQILRMGHRKGRREAGDPRAGGETLARSRCSRARTSCPQLRQHGRTNLAIRQDDLLKLAVSQEVDTTPSLQRLVGGTCAESDPYSRR